MEYIWDFGVHMFVADLTGSETRGSAEEHRQQNTGTRNQRPGSLSARMSLETPMMTTPAAAIKDEVRVLIDVQIEAFGQPTPLTPSELREFHSRSEKISTLCQELNRIGTRRL